MYEVKYEPFRINMNIDGETLIVVNEGDSLLFEDYNLFKGDNIDPLKEKFEDVVSIENIKKDALTPIID
jgi:hypothetical protein